MAECFVRSQYVSSFVASLFNFTIPCYDRALSTKKAFVLNLGVSQVRILGRETFGGE